MKKKVKNLKTGDVFMVQMPSGEMAQCTILNSYLIKKAKNKMTVQFKGETTELSLDDYVEVTKNIGTKIQILSEEQVKRLTKK